MTVPAPLTPPDCDLRGMPFMALDVVTSPAGATRCLVILSPAGVGGLTSMAARRLKLEAGANATLWTDDQAVIDLSATTTQQSLAIIDLENQQAIASWRIKSEASGSKPAIIEAVSALGGSYVAFGAEQVYFGDNTVFDDATDTIQTIIGGRIRVTAWGAPFGLYGDLLEWWGPTGIALSSMTPGNGYSGRMISPPYVFDNVVAGASGSAAARKESFSNSFAMGNTWSTVEVFTPVGVPSSPFVSANIEWQGPPSVSDTSVWNGEMRLVEAATGTVVAAPQAFSITHNNEPFAVALSGAGVSAGAVQYALQARRTSGSNTVTAVGFAINFDAYQRL